MLNTTIKTCIRFAKRKPLGAISAIIVILMLLIALLAPVLAPYNPVANDFASQLQSPNLAHWMGTDTFGRDVLSRVIYGAQSAMLIGFVSSIMGASIGALLGLMSAFFGGRVDLFLQRVLDILMSFPVIILALAVVAALGINTMNLIIAIMLTMIPRVARVVRASALSVREMVYIEAAIAIGASKVRILLLHMMPNVMASFLIMLTAQLGQAILLEASLSFIGLGVAEPTPAWGLMLKGAAIEFLETAPWMAIFPGLAISIAVFSFNLLGDALRDVLDPKLYARSRNP
jgi:peptide/nickel transport system permease protein